MKKQLPKIVSVLCVIAVLVLMLWPNWIVQKGYKSKELKSIKQELADDITFVKEKLINSSVINMDEFKDAGLSLTKTRIKKDAGLAKDIVNILLDGKLTPPELAKLSVYSAMVVNIANKLKNVEETSELMSAAYYGFLYEDFNSLCQEYGDVFSLGYFVLLIPLLMILAFGFGVLNIVCTILNGKKTYKIPFFIFVIVTVALFAAIQISANTLIPLLKLEKAFTLSLTCAPITCAVLSLVPMILLKKDKKGEHKNG